MSVGTMLVCKAALLPQPTDTLAFWRAPFSAGCLLRVCSFFLPAAAYALMQELMAGGNFPQSMLPVCDSVLEV